MSSATNRLRESRSLRYGKTVESDIPIFKSRFYKNTASYHKTRRPSEGTKPTRYQSTENLLDSNNRNFSTDSLSSRNSETTLSRTFHDSKRKCDTTFKQNFRSSRIFSTSQPNLHLRRQPVDLVDIGFEANGRQVDTQFSKDNNSLDTISRTLVDSLKDSKCNLEQLDKLEHVNKEHNPSSTIKTATFRENQSTDFKEMKDTQQKLNCNQNVRVESLSFIHEYSDLDYESTTDDDDDDDDNATRETDRETTVISNFNDESNFAPVINNPIRRAVNRSTLSDVPSGWDGRPVVISHLESKAVLDGDQVILNCRIIGTSYELFRQR